MNPMIILQIKEKIDTFQKEHPRMQSYFSTIVDKALTEGRFVEIKTTSIDGKEYVAKIKATTNDIALIDLLSRIGG